MLRSAVTGAFGYSGKYIAKKLLNRGDEVITLTNSPDRFNPFGEKVKAVSFHFDKSGNTPFQGVKSSVWR